MKCCDMGLDSQNFIFFVLNKLECLSLASLYSPVCCYTSLLASYVMYNENEVL